MDTNNKVFIKSLYDLQTPHCLLSLYDAVLWTLSLANCSQSIMYQKIWMLVNV